ncbi:MAG: hypothetical protein RQ735_12030 [Flavobacteriaceae bacterium]|nr:hypothetical protein [Flavobacteriaceae bacterium]
MKKIILTLANLLIITSVFAQAPEKVSYQAVIRDGSNNLIVSTPIGMQISILQGSSSGTAVYVETHTPTTNVNGLVSIEIGAGAVISGTFATIDWSNGPYFIKTETDPTGGTTFSITGTSQLLSVPYALHAKTAGTLAFAEFYALMPGDNAATVAAGTAVDFPQNGPSSGAITRLTSNQFILADIGTYMVSWQVSISEAGQLVLALNDVEIPHTVVGRATGTTQIIGNSLITTTTINSDLSVRNPSGNPVALTVTPVAGGTQSVSASLVIRRIQ